MKPNIGITQKELKKSTSLLNVLLSNEMTLYVKTRKFHWNIGGNSFMELHKLFEGQYNALEAIIDEVAERINKLGEKTIGTMKEFLDHTTLKESPNTYPNQKEMLAELLDNHEHIITEIRESLSVYEEEANDAGTTDFVTGIMQKHETMAWIIRRYLS
ncbi:Dps family protein [Flavobacterium agrisoli]|uniref:DNA starvation/stationary phase protection protein n=1 Tax=Flavobacterium agrisoli TaxID=2793066 RepID=A0A934PJ56_9FLAO|nr:DNA starvation/stationary phase protection protein [Flavobacterium agrisoli]MBK0369086.1 DNA starvation/stationary phase protection protein [Flavobacterium agrisoli]